MAVEDRVVTTRTTQTKIPKQQTTYHTRTIKNNLRLPISSNNVNQYKYSFTFRLALAKNIMNSLLSPMFFYKIRESIVIVKKKEFECSVKISVPPEPKKNGLFTNSVRMYLWRDECVYR